ncbi:MAG: transcriptional regulator with XRE-family HTH domain [Parvibaculaceae bacterium]|jgi:transcriptional regulator with XRE-family HTH domain
MPVAPKTDTYQTIQSPDGEALFKLVPVDELETLKSHAQKFLDLQAATTARVSPADLHELIPADVVHRIADGDSPVRVWREQRGLKAVQLARAAGISPAYLSEIETGKKDGTFRTMTSIAACLGVPLDDLAPAAADSNVAERERSARITRIRAQIRRIEELVVGEVDFNTGAVRQAADLLAGEAQQLLLEQYNPGGWLDEVMRGVEEITHLVQRAEGDIIETAQTTRADLERVVSLSSFRKPPVDAPEAADDTPVKTDPIQAAE